MQYRVVNVTEGVTALCTDDIKLATDYHAQCVRGSERFNQRTNTGKPIVWVLEESEE